MLGIGGGFQYKLAKKLFVDFSAKWNIMNNVKLVEADNNETIKGVDKNSTIYWNTWWIELLLLKYKYYVRTFIWQMRWKLITIKIF